MNPRHRRLLIPGLLTALLVVVVVAAIADHAEAAEDGPVVTIGDPRITESSGLAVSTRHDDLAYTVNDSGNASEVYAVDLTSGDVVGVTSVRADFRDVEALALRDGTLWIGDIGDNNGVRVDLALYAIDEPGRKTATVDPRRFPVRWDSGPGDVEALLADPDSDELVVVTKTLAGATALAIEESRLDPGRPGVFRTVAEGLPALVTDGAFSPDGARVALLTYGSLWTVDPADWSVVGRQPLPSLVQSETVAFDGADTVLVGSEGERSPLHRLTLSPDTTQLDHPGRIATDTPASAPTTTPTAASPPAPADDSDSGSVVLLGGAGAAGVAALAALVAWRLRARSSRAR